METDSIISLSMHEASKSPSVTSEKKRLEKACKQFEGVFLSHLLKSLRKTVDRSDLFGSRKHEDMWQEMLDQEIVDSIANTHSTGLANMLYRQLSAQLDKSAPATDKRGKEQ